ncbi:GntR family transcriptional regulator [Pseudonocardia sp. EC080610-09]|uniref:GntR family transcriptional regulator n=1 Tax=unclassified Pseudonocardia TaxID=2619320 RepID=UPI0006CB40A4|nr:MULTISPECIES: GntR family transcriptional regulator [unclassified Pseudonocardia]ALE73541.1 GntR family transcriptional regulator [Pseudonocardia sp. EC080625-04]ALL76927.1 GntR family transcriptional regulator [Pseudonocardia sp. EC080610-09]ALL83958.1 GntR family transcriptional regulator [Pseudonocardia sp. EC080619-01]
MPARSTTGRGVQRRSMAVEVAEHIRSMIFDGRLSAEQRIPQDAIAAELGVSRLPVREALITLETDGLVAAEPHRGTFVVPIRSEDIEDHYRLYGMAQGLASAGAARRITEPVLTRLDELHRRMSSTDDPDLVHDLNWEFHSLINHTGASRRTLSVLRQLSHNLPREVYGIPQAASPSATRQHAAIIEALRARDGAAADHLNQEHARAEGDEVVAVLKRNGILSN